MPWYSPGLIRHAGCREHAITSVPHLDTLDGSAVDAAERKRAAIRVRNASAAMEQLVDNARRAQLLVRRSSAIRCSSSPSLLCVSLPSRCRIESCSISYHHTAMKECGHPRVCHSKGVQGRGTNKTQHLDRLS